MRQRLPADLDAVGGDDSGGVLVCLAEQGPLVPRTAEEQLLKAHALRAQQAVPSPVKCFMFQRGAEMLPKKTGTAFKLAQKCVCRSHYATGSPSNTVYVH